MNHLSLLVWSPIKRTVFGAITLGLLQAAARAARPTKVPMNGLGTAPKALRRAKIRLVRALILVTTALMPAPQAAADDGPYFYIVNSRTRMMAEVFAHHTNDGARVVLWPHYGGSSQQFTVQRLPQLGNPYEPLEEQWFLLRTRHSDKCLKTDGYQSGAAVVQATCSGTPTQMWRVRTVIQTAEECADRNQCFGGRRLVLENYYDRGRRCLDAANGAFPAPPGQGTGLQAWDCIPRFSAPNAVNQEWDLVNIQDWDAPGPVVR